MHQVGHTLGLANSDDKSNTIMSLDDKVFNGMSKYDYLRDLFYRNGGEIIKEFRDDLEFRDLCLTGESSKKTQEIKRTKKSEISKEFNI